MDILLADDHLIVRQGLKQILASLYQNISFDEAQNSQEVIGQICKNDYDVILLDISMPGRNGLEILSELKQIKPDIPVLILSMFSEDQYAIRALKAGASGYLTKDCDPEELMGAIRKVMDGKKHFSEAVVDQILTGFKDGWDETPHDTLSAREFQVMCMIAAGKRLSEIAEELLISLSSVSTHRSRILRKMNFRTNADIVRYAVERQLV